MGLKKKNFSDLILHYSILMAKDRISIKEQQIQPVVEFPRRLINMSRSIEV